MKYLVKSFGVLALLACLGSAPLVLAQTALEGNNLSALAPENLAKPRPEAPFDMTGTWNMIIDPETGMHEFMPLPTLTPAAEEQLALVKEWAEQEGVDRAWG